jgi:hypothetical protein
VSWFGLGGLGFPAGTTRCLFLGMGWGLTAFGAG